MVDLGSKHECPSCGAKFYDLGKPDPTCPKCGANPTTAEEEEQGKKAPPASRAKAVKAKAPSPAPDAASDSEDGADDDSEE